MAEPSDHDAEPSRSTPAPGILFYDPSPTTAKLATASLRLAGYRVFIAANRDDAARLCKAHGPAGDAAIVAVVLDASVDPRTSASILAALVAVPGGSELPGILLVSPRNTTPIPGATELPTLRRPFSGPALLRIVAETLEDADVAVPKGRRSLRDAKTQLKEILKSVWPGRDIGETELSRLLVGLRDAEAAPAPVGDPQLQGSLRATSMASLLEMLGSEGSRGILSVRGASGREGRLHLDRSYIHLAEYTGDDEDLKIGRFVVEGGFMRDEDLEAFIVGRDRESLPLGKRLAQAGLLSTKEVSQILVAQAREVCCHLIGWREGRFQFRPTAGLHPLAVSAAEDGGNALLVSEAILDGLRRIDDRAEMGSNMPGVDDVFLRIDEQIARVGRDALEHDELAVLELVNGRRSIKEIARKTRAGTYSVSRTLFRLSKAKLTRRRTAAILARAGV